MALLSLRRDIELLVCLMSFFWEWGLSSGYLLKILSKSRVLFLRYLFTYFTRFYLLIFLERGERKEKERERNINVWLPLVYPLVEIWPATQACALTGN